MFRLVLFYTKSFPYYSNRCFTDEVQSSHALTIHNPSRLTIHPSPLPSSLLSPAITNSLNFTLTPHLYPHP